MARVSSAVNTKRTAPTKPARDGQKTAETVREAAAELFYTHGYESTSLREVASLVGIQVGSLYNHISGKDQLLSIIMIEVMEDLLAAMSAATDGLEDPVERLTAAIDCLIRFHAERRRDVFIGNSELRSLAPEDRKVVVSLRKRYEHSLTELVTAAAAEAEGDIIDPKLQVFAIVAIGSHVASWYLPGRGYSLDLIVDTYTSIIFRQLAIARQEPEPNSDKKTSLLSR